MTARETGNRTARGTAPRRSLATRLRRTLKAAIYSGPCRDRWQRPDEVVSALAAAPGSRVADIGAGGGYLTFRLARAVGPEGRVDAVDSDADMTSLVADRARRRGLHHVVAVRTRPEDPGLDGPVDLAVMVNAFHHLPDPTAYLRALAGALAPDGRVAVIEASPTRWTFGHATEPAEVRASLEAAGYEVTAEHDDLLPRQGFVVARPVRATP